MDPKVANKFENFRHFILHTCRETLSEETTKKIKSVPTPMWINMVAGNVLRFRENKRFSDLFSQDIDEYDDDHFDEAVSILKGILESESLDFDIQIQKNSYELEKLEKDSRAFHLVSSDLATLQTKKEAAQTVLDNIDKQIKTMDHLTKDKLLRYISYFYILTSTIQHTPKPKPQPQVSLKESTQDVTPGKEEEEEEEEQLSR